ncbi:MAG: lipocalin-like domain-containing protein [Pseudomonadota bacterium]
MSAKTFLLLVLLAPSLAWAQGFAGLGTSADEGFSVPARGTQLTFPGDHGPHPSYRIEWWYLTVVLEGEDGRDYGAQWTLFRSALAPEAGEGWSAPQLWMGHAAVTTPKAHFVAERLSRGGVGQAGAQAEPFEAWIDEWSMRSTAPEGADAYSALRVAASGADFAYTLVLEADGPLVAHGDAGFSVKSAQGQASYYYSQPFFQVSGTLELPGGAVDVTGRGWLDREWSSQPLSEDQRGWDWFSLHLPGGERLMAFQLRQTGGTIYTSGTWIAADGTPDALPDGAIRFTALEETAVAGRDVPTRWRVEIPSHGLDVTTRAVNPEAWMDTLFPYWEGPLRFEGSHAGVGYLEMTGYE